MNLRKLISNCTSASNLTQHDFEHIAEVLPELATVMRLNSEISDAIFDQHGIGVVAEHEKDDLVMYRRRTCILNNIGFVTKGLAKKAILPRLKQYKLE